MLLGHGGVGISKASECCFLYLTLLASKLEKISSSQVQEIVWDELLSEESNFLGFYWAVFLGCESLSYKK